MKPRPKVVAFDVIGTVFPLEPLREPLKRAGLPDQTLELWFAQILLNGFALEVSGVFKSFQEVARATLEILLSRAAGPETAREAANTILEHLKELSPASDAAEAFEVLHQSGILLLALTNGSAGATRNLLAQGRLERYVEHVISIDKVRHWKPAREVYHHAAQTAGVSPTELGLIAAHAWDIHGASEAGLVTGFVSRLEEQFLPLMATPDVSGGTLLETAQKVLSLPDGIRPRA